MEKSIKMPTADFEKMLLEQVSKEMDPQHLSALTRSISRLQASYLIDWSWLGTPRFWDLVKLNYQIPVNEFRFESLIGSDLVSEIRIFRKGIPVPVFYDVEVLVRNSKRQF